MALIADPPLAHGRAVVVAFVLFYLLSSPLAMEPPPKQAISSNHDI